jgi:lactate dehydrogenase-like 2-hydroxyacid dehydrogenase
MTQMILWPGMRWPDDREVEKSAIGSGMRAEFVDRMEQVTDELWRSCDGIVSVLDIGPERRAKLDRCRILVTPSVGFNLLDLEAWGALGIPICNVPDYGTMEVADHAIALMLTLMKGIEFHTAQLRADPRGNWRPALNPYGRRLSVCTFGVVGIGRIGTAAALRAKAFGMDVAFYDPYVENGLDLALGIRRVDTLDELMRQSDVVSIHAPLTDETNKLVGTAAFAAAKRGLIVVNTARGPIIDLDALHDAMRSDIVKAAGLDVLPEEPANPAHPLIQAFAAGDEWLAHRLVLTPHSAFFTPESAHDMRAKAAQVAATYLRDGRLMNCVNGAFLRSQRR